MSGRGMNRRGHLSSKIPNVKLRPASSAAPNRKTREADPLNAMDEELLRRAAADAEDEDVSSAALRSTRRPWERVVITFTGVDDKPKLTDLARQLGADIQSALTKETTHVVASNFGSAKYLYAVEHRIPVMTPEWILSTHASWINAEEVDVISSMEGMKLLAFTGVKISVSGVNDMDRRKQIIKVITENGGVYSKDLDGSATHLVSAQPTEIRAPSEKVKWAVKELKMAEALRRAGKPVKHDDIKIVYEDWIWDCVGYEGRWKEDWYDARKVRRPCRTKYEEVISGEAKERMQQAVKVETAKAEEPAMLRKRKRDAMDNLVGDLISTANGGSSRPKLEFKVTRTDISEIDVDTETDELFNEVTADAEDTPTPASRRPSGPAPSLRKTSILHSSRTASFAGPSKLSRELQLETTFSASIPATQHPARAALPAGRVKQVFAGMRCTLVMVANMDAILEALKTYGAQVVSEDDWRNGERVDYVIVRLTEHVHPDLSWIPEEDLPQIGTDCWIEASVFEQRMLPLDDHVVFRPLDEGFPLRGAERWCVHVAGYPVEQSVFIRRLAKAIGITYSEKLNRQTTHLVTPVSTGRKFDRATEWNVEIVRESWLIAMGLSGRLEQADSYRVQEGEKGDSPSTRRPSGRSGSATAANREAEHVVKASSGIEVENIVKEEEHEEAGDAREEYDHYDTMEPLPNLGETNNHLSPLPKAEPSHLFAVKAAPAISSPTTITALRKLKLVPTPTHVDLATTTDRNHRSSTSMSATSFPLSPPKAETERLLNHAHGPAPPSAKRRIQSDFDHPKDAESIESKLSRNSSAPVPITSSPTAPIKSPAAARSTSYPNLGRPAMSEMLKLLAQPSDPSLSSPASTTGSRSTRPIRRPRTSAASTGVSRLRTSMAYSATEREGSEMGDMTVETTLRFSSSPPPNFGMMMPDGPGGNMDFDESMRVNYVDPVAEKEKKKLFEAVLKHASGVGSAPNERDAKEESEFQEEEIVKVKPKSKKRRT